jgi:hypothetical protein
MEGSRVERNLDCETCLDLVRRFYLHLDRREYEQLDALMARDGVYFRPHGRPIPAGATLVEDLGEIPPTKRIVHLLTNLHAEQRAAGNIKVSGYMTVFWHDDGTLHTGPVPLGVARSIRELDIELQKQEGTWQIRKIENVKLMEAT